MMMVEDQEDQHVIGKDILPLISTPYHYLTLSYSGDFHLSEFSDLESSGDEGKSKVISRSKSNQSKNRSKECPGCGAQLGLAIKECTYCDYTFTSKSMLTSTQSAIDESRSIRNRFPFEPERVSSWKIPHLIHTLCLLLSYP